MKTPLRQRQLSQTKELILQAAAAVLRADGFQAFAIDRVAEEAGVSARTIYRHFDDRDQLLQAAGDVIDASTPYTLPETADEIAVGFEKLFRHFDTESRDEQRGLLAARITGTMLWEGRARRVEAVGNALNDVTDLLSPAEARRAKAVVAYLANSLAWLSLYDESGLDGRESGAAIGWAIQTLVDDLRKRNRKARGQKGGRRG